ncbi:GntR family transcriptional regulator [Leucobacter zeae]|nr:GntR family transcriptional regulator [Leucobacter zeae]
MEIDESRPIWAQLVDEFCRRIVSGEWPSGRKLPSVRELALDLGVNPNTVQKALAEVDRRGLTSTERTSGRFVTTDAEAVSAARRAIAAETVDGFAIAVSGIGMSLAEATDLLAGRWRIAVADPAARVDPEPHREPSSRTTNAADSPAQDGRTNQ